MPLGLGIITEICGNTYCQSQWECQVCPLGMHFFPLWSPFQATQQLSIQTKYMEEIVAFIPTTFYCPRLIQ